MAGVYVAIFIISCLILMRSGVWVVRALIRIAQFLKWKEFIVASFIMAFSTSLPEIFVGVTSALAQKPNLSFGVVIGSNIVDLTLILGIGALLAKGLTLRGRVVQRNAFYAGIYGLLPLLLMIDGNISRADGAVLLLSMVFYFAQLLSEEERFTRVFSDHLDEGWAHFKIFIKDLLFFGGAIVALLLSAEGIVYSSSQLAANFNLSLLVIGAVLVSLGTSLPEIALGAKAISMGHKKIIIGDLMGAIVVNSSFVLGLSAVICPLTITDFSPYFVGIIFTVVTCFFFVAFARTDRKITAREAIFLIGIYFFFLISEIMLK